MVLLGLHKTTTWCPGRDSNPHTFRRQNLNLVRLPISPPGQAARILPLSLLPPYSSMRPMPVEHYENFPVASLLVPAKLRRPIEVIYHFARSADDIADEGDALPAEASGRSCRLSELSWIGSKRARAANAFVCFAGRGHRRPCLANPAFPRPARCLRAGCRQEALRRLPRIARLLPPLRQPGRPAGAASVRPHRA
jgi:hypothetical protein